MKRQTIVILCPCLLILLFGYSGLDKGMSGQAFTSELNNQPLPNSWTPALRWGIPVIDMLIIVLLLFRRTDRLGFIISMAWLALFSGYIVIVLLNLFPYVPCSCAGGIRGLTWRWHLVLNLFFLVVAGVGWGLNRKRVVAE